MENKKNVFERLQNVRVELQQKEMKKSGKNNFSHYDYFELADFLPLVNELCSKHHITPIVTFTTQEAKLTIYNQDDRNDFVEFTSPFVICELKGSNKIQALGSSHTYLRRYLYLTAFEIVESDGIDGLSVEDRKEVEQVKQEDDKKEKLIKEIIKNKENKELQLAIKNELKETNAKSIKELPLESLVKICKEVIK